MLAPWTLQSGSVWYTNAQHSEWYTDAFPVEKESVYALDVWPGSDSDMLCEDGFDIRMMFWTKHHEFETLLSIMSHVSGLLVDASICNTVISADIMSHVDVEAVVRTKSGTSVSECTKHDTKYRNSPWHVFNQTV